MGNPVIEAQAPLSKPGWQPDLFCLTEYWDKESISCKKIEQNTGPEATA